jgi:hypothetical protein
MIFEIRYREYNGAPLTTVEIEADNIQEAREKVQNDAGNNIIIENSKRVSG